MPAREFVVLYTHQIRRRKTRVWQDGFLRLSSVGTKAVLLDSRSCQLDTLHVKPSQLTIGSELESDRFLVTLEEERLSEPLLSPCTTSEIANRVTNQCDQKQVPTSQIFQPPRQAYSKQPPHVSPSSSVGLLPRVDAKSEQNNRPEGPVKYSAGAPCDLRRNRAEILALLEPRYSELQNNMAVSSGSSLDLHLPFVTDCEDSALRHNSSKQDTGSLGYGIQGKVERNSGKEVKLNRNGFDNGVEFGSLSLSSDFDLSSNLDLTFGDPNSQAATGGSYQFDSLFENAKSLGAENGFDEKQVSGKSRNLRENVEAEIQNESEMMDGRQNVLQDKQNRDGWGNNVKTDSLEESADDLQLGGSMNVWKMVHQNKLKNVDNGDNDKCGKMEEKEASLQPNKVTNENEIDGCSNLGQIADGKFDEDCDMDQKWDDLDNLELLGLDVIEEKVEKIFCEEIDDMKHDSLEELREDIENGETRPIASVEDVFADDVGRIRSEFHAREGECISQHTAPRRDFGMMMHANNDPMVSEKRLALQCMHDAAAADFEDLTTLQTPRREGDFCDIPTLPTVTSTQLSQHGTSNPDFHPLQSDPCSTPVQVVMTAVPPRAPFEVREGDRILPMVPRVSRPVCKSSRWSKYQKPCDDLTFEIGQFDRDMREPRLVKEQNSEAANQNEQDFNSEPESVLSKCYADDCHEQWTLQENTKPVALKQKTLEMGRFLLDDKHLGLISGNNKMPEGTITKTSMSKEMITGSKLDPGMMRKVKQTPPMTFRKSRIIDMGEENEYSTLTGVTTASPSPQENFEVPWLIEMEVEEAKKDLKRRETRRPGGLRRRLGLAPLVGCQKPQSVVGGDLQRGRDGLRGCGGDSRGGRGRGRSEGSQTLRSELCFPSSGVALTVSRGSALREYSIPLSFFSVSSYRNALSLAITEHLNLLLLDAAHCYHRNLRSQLGSTPTPSHCAPSSVLQSGNVVLYKNCYLFNRRRARRGCKEEPIKALLFLHLSARRPHSAYNKDDLWVVSRDGLFAAKTTFIACSSFYGPSADGELELTPLHGYSPSEWTENVTVFALWVCNISNELSCLRNISANLAHGSPPILHALLNPPSRATAVVHAVRPGFRPPRQCSGQSATLDAKHLASELEQIERRLGLNAEQTAALRQVSAMVSGHSAQSVTLIQGVFGAGKSFLLAVIVCFLSRVFKAAGPRPGNSPWRVLVSAATNMAVDGVLLGLLQQGFTEFVRVGSIKKIVKAILPYSLHAGQGSEPGELVTMLREAVSPAERALLRRALEVQRLGRNKKLLSQVSVVGVTCAASPFSCLDHMSFPVVVLDEASQMTEPTSLLPLARFGCEKLILVGDPKQLAPTISGSESHHGNGLEQTLFNRLRLLGHEPVFLSTQYRCHPTIGQLSGSLFYDRHLRNGVTATERSPAVHWLPTLALYNVSGQEQLTRDGSWQNDAETKLVVKLVEALVDDGVPGSHIGVITPYRAQVKQISNHLVSVLAYCPDMARSVLVSTVDAFQGGERDAVIVSCVRTCVQGARDETRRVTVALTRAKRHLAIIACIAGLKPSPLWGKVIQYCQDISCVHDASDIFSTLDRIIESRGSWKPGEEIRPEENWEKPKESLEKPEESLEKLEKSLEKLEESLEKPECISRKARGKEHLAQEPERQHKWRKRKKDKGVFQVEKRLKGSKSKAVLASRPCFLPSDAESIEQQGTITC